MKRTLMLLGALLLLAGFTGCTKDEPEKPKPSKVNDAHKGIVIIPTTTTQS